MLWDRGTGRRSKARARRISRKAISTSTLDGERMKGEWLLVRMKPRPGEKRENWLLSKVNDAEETGEAPAEACWPPALTSVQTGRTMAEIAVRRRARRKPISAEAAPRAAAFTSRCRRQSPRATNRAAERTANGRAKPPNFRHARSSRRSSTAVPDGGDWLTTRSKYRRLSRRWFPSATVASPASRGTASTGRTSSPDISPMDLAASRPAATCTDRRRDRRRTEDGNPDFSVAANGAIKTRAARKPARSSSPSICSISKAARIAAQEARLASNARSALEALLPATLGPAALSSIATMSIGDGEKASHAAMCERGPGRHHLEARRRRLLAVAGRRIG